jgi:hypothetical protein
MDVLKIDCFSSQLPPSSAMIAANCKFDFNDYPYFPVLATGHLSDGIRYQSGWCLEYSHGKARA